MSIWRARVRQVGRGQGRPLEAAGNPKAEGDVTMRFTMLVKAKKAPEAGVLPSRELVAAMASPSRPSWRRR